jgi:hypothetical protein
MPRQRPSTDVVLTPQAFAWRITQRLTAVSLVYAKRIRREGDLYLPVAR